MSWKISYKFTTPKKGFDPNRMINNIMGVHKEYEKIVRKEYEGVVKHWKHGVPIKTEVGSTGDTIFTLAFADDDIFGYVTNGTSVRYATMTPDFQPKTHPGTLQTGPGAGEVDFVSKRQPRPGIEAREFERQIGQKHEKGFIKDIRAAIRKGLQSK